MKRGGLTATNFTCSIWENFRDTMLNISEWHKMFAANNDIILQVKCVDDVRRAKADGKVGIILGFQNISAIEDRIDAFSLFKELGVGVMQLTYNGQNLAGTGCWENYDGGLSNFGHDAIEEMNAHRILIDLSHVGPKTAGDAIGHSKQPVAFTHVAPLGLYKYGRNKSDEQLRAISERGGFVGVSTYTPFMAEHAAKATLDDIVSMIEYVINICGEESVGIGTDMTQGRDEAFFDWVRADRGTGKRMVTSPYKTPPALPGFTSLSDYGNLTAAFEKRGWSEKRILGVIGGNWLRFLGDVWAGATAR
ncbi:MAG: peptidase M19 [Mesorhizobium sp.]|nr:MAG: peptidase M19 [Mesorhizobium sp.]